MNTAKHVLCCLLMCVATTGCAYAPQPIARPLEGQKTIEAARHWQIMAEQLAEELDISAPTFIPEEDISAFGRAFTAMLRSAILKRNGTLAADWVGAVTVRWNTQIIRYAEPRKTITAYPGSYAILAGIGIGASQIMQHNPAKYAGSIAAGAIGIALEAGQQMTNIVAPYPIDTEILFTFVQEHGGIPYKEGVAIFYTRRSDAVLYYDRDQHLDTATKQYKIIGR